jgi:hypothetical protein
MREYSKQKEQQRIRRSGLLAQSVNKPQLTFQVGVETCKAVS